MLAFQPIKEAGLRLPKPIGGAMSIVSGLILVESAVGAGIALRITMIHNSLKLLSLFLNSKSFMDPYPFGLYSFSWIFLSFWNTRLLMWRLYLC